MMRDFGLTSRRSRIIATIIAFLVTGRCFAHRAVIRAFIAQDSPVFILIFPRNARLRFLRISSLPVITNLCAGVPLGPWEMVTS